MSRTDHHRPYSIRAFFEGELNHYHAEGICVPEELRHAIAPRRRYGRHTCGKRETFTFSCPGYSIKSRWDRETDYCYTARRELEDLIKNRELFSPHAYLPGTYGMSKRFCNRQHTRSVYHKDWACEVCDDVPTCYHTLNWRERPYRHVPKWYRDAVWTNVERGRERLELDRVAKEFNAGEDIEDADFPNFQHRRGACWMYH